MDEKTGAEEQTKQKNGVSRRRLLKLLAAAGLAVSVERLLPGGWLRPAASVSAGGFPGYPGTCTADSFPLFIKNSRAALNATTGAYQVQFTFNEVGGYLDNEACIFASVLGGPVVYKGNTLLEANGYVAPEWSSIALKPCLEPVSNASRSILPTANVYEGNGTYYFFYPEGTSSGAPTGRDAADNGITVEWYLLQPDDRMSNTVQTVTTPTAVSLSDFIVDSSSVKAGAAAGALAAAALGAATIKALSGDDGAEEAE